MVRSYCAYGSKYIKDYFSGTPLVEGICVIELTAELKTTYIETARMLKGSERRVFMARIVRSLGHGGQSLAIRELGWCYLDNVTLGK